MTVREKKTTKLLYSITTSHYIATIKRSLSTRTDAVGYSEIILRLSVSRSLVIRIKSGIFVNAKRFKGGAFVIPRSNQEEANEVRAIEELLIDTKRFLVKLCESTMPELLDKEYILDQLELFRNLPIAIYSMAQQLRSSRELAEFCQSMLFFRYFH